MPVPVPSETRCHTRRTRDFGGLYAALVLLSFHWALVIYVNSSFLAQFFTDHTISLLYTVSAALTVFGFLFITPVLRRIGTVRLAIGLSLIECMTMLSLPFVEFKPLIAFLFIVHQSVVPVILFSLDIFMEALIGDCEKETGGRRGLFLTIMSLTIALSALLSGYLVGDREPHFELVYVTSALLLIPFLFIIVRSFRGFKDNPYAHAPLREGLMKAWRHRDIRFVFSAHFILQLFFSWMVIYTPIYLSTVMGFDWEQIGQILFVGLMAYVFLEYAIGVIADTWLGEKEMMAVGFLIMAVATSWFTFLTPTEIGLWMVAMFMTRVGASLVETTTESYFFKHTHGDDTALISFFRITRPLSIVIGSILGSLTLVFLPMHLLFIVLGLLMIPGLFFTMSLRDTK
jgi:predicted MFS family arabinose efflux permease